MTSLRLNFITVDFSTDLYHVGAERLVAGIFLLTQAFCLLRLLLYTICDHIAMQCAPIVISDGFRGPTTILKDK